MIILQELLKQYQETGYFIIKNLVTEVDTNLIIKEIIDTKDSLTYVDRSGKIRRIERIFDKGKNLKKLDNIFKEYLEKIFNKKFNLFKDKYNAKPPGGEGFYSHYDGIFMWTDSENQEQKGWHVYSDMFINTLVALDDCNEENGCLELAYENKGTFEELLKNTKNNGTPDILPSIEEKLDFKKIILNKGDAVFFSSRCPHRSKKNSSKFDRRIIYYTYNPKKFGDFYEQYFEDKEKSKNKNSKSLSGKV